ncbi:hypothetical protein N9K95_03650 [Schleiferiaceae bacterium]|nr:hypothetical protein [Schleiferiaceae bacterium]
MLKRLSNLLLLCLLTQVSHQLRAQESAVDILVKWNSYHNNKASSGFQNLYHDSVFYYGKSVSNDYCSNSKSKALSGKSYSQYLQNVHERTIGKYFIRLDFDKLVTYNGKTNSYPSYLVLRRGEEGLKICVEGDKITDRTLSQKYRSDIPNDYIAGDFDGDGQLEKAWVVRPEIAGYIDNEGEYSCEIYFSDYSIPIITYDGCIDLNIENLGDLNNDGVDEIGVQRVWITSTRTFYSVYVMCHNNWKEAIVVDIHRMDSTWPIVQAVGEKIKINEIVDSAEEGYFERTRLIDFPEVY